MNEQIIHIQWDGPYTYQQALAFRSPTDYGVYQVHGASPVSGLKTLLYIGKAELQTFGKRLSQERWPPYELGNGSVEFYLGRPSGAVTPDDATWNRQIHIAERLLITAHKPGHNRKDIGAFDVAEFHPLHILNWGNRGGLMAEVSGARWSSRFAVIEGYAPFGSHTVAVREDREEADETEDGPDIEPLLVAAP